MHCKQCEKLARLKIEVTVCRKEIRGLYKPLLMRPKFGRIKGQRSQNKKGDNK